ncbi:MAG TPA: MarR family transcriptional regulator [Acidimicrobiales bacterium]|nr:MarR family transcriptional regulator [Acidimicrobiales bacterium]
MRLLNALHCGGDQTMSDLASALDVTPRRVTALVDALEADGLLTRTPNPMDGRSKIISITSEGEMMQRLDWEPHETEVGLVFTDLSKEQRKQLLPITKRLTDALRARMAERTR